MTQLIRSREGVITAAEFVEHSALPLDEADEEMGRLVGAYAGEPLVSPNGEIVFAFPELMASAHGAVEKIETRPAWRRLEYALEVTGNTADTNLVIGALNGFNLIMAMAAPVIIFPPLGISGPVAELWLVSVPSVFSFLFFAIPLLRLFGIRLENRRRAKRNIRRVLLGLVYSQTLDGKRGVGVDDAMSHVERRLNRDQIATRRAVEKALHHLAAEFEANVSPDADGEALFFFHEIMAQFTASETVRRKLELDERPLGEIVFSMADTSEEATARDLSLFDRQLRAEESDFARYLPSIERTAFDEDDDEEEFATADEDAAQ